MANLKPLGVVRDYSEMQQLFRRYVNSINVSRATIDDAAGFADGYASKALAPVPMKGFGRSTLGDFLQSLGLVLIIAQDVDAYARCRRRLPERDIRQVRPDDGRKRGPRKKHQGAQEAA